MKFKEIIKNLNEDIISSKADDSDFQQLKKRFEELKATGRWNNLRDLKWEFMRRRENQILIDRMGKDKINVVLDRLWKSKK